MGEIIAASCHQCGYHRDEVVIGGGKATHTVLCEHPAYCAHCHSMVSVNLYGGEPVCPECGGVVRPYCNSPEMQQTPGDFPVSQWADYVLNNGDYLCPSCGSFALRFNVDENFILFD